MTGCRLSGHAIAFAAKFRAYGDLLDGEISAHETCAAYGPGGLCGTEHSELRRAAT